MNAIVNNRRMLKAGTALVTSLGGFALALPALAQSLPTGGTVVTGTVDISNTGTTGAISIGAGAANNPVVTWTTFDVPTGQAITVTAGDALPHTILNRVMGVTAGPPPGRVVSPSIINGAINTPDNVSFWLVNPAGITFGAGGAYSGGSLVLSTLDIAAIPASGASTTFDVRTLGGGQSFAPSATQAVTIANAANGLAANGSILILGQKVSIDDSVVATGGNLTVVAANRVTFGAGLASPLTFNIDVGTSLSFADDSGVQILGSGVLAGQSVTVAAVSPTVAVASLLHADTGASLTATGNNGVVTLATKAVGTVSVTGPNVARDLAVNTGTGASSGLRTTAANGSVSVAAGGNATLAGRVVASGTGTYLVDAASATLGGGGSVTQNGAAGITVSTTDNILANADAALSSTGTIAFASSAGNAVVRSGVTAGNLYTASGATGVTLGGAVTQQAANGITATAVAGNATTEAGLTLRTTAATGDVTINAAAGNALLSSAVDAGDDYMVAARTIQLGNVAATQAAADIIDMTASAGDISGGAGLTLQATNTVFLDASAAGTVNLAATSAVNATNVGVDAAAAQSVAVGNVTAGSFGRIVGPGHASVSNTLAGITNFTGGTVALTGALTLNATGNVRAVSIGSGALNITAGGDITGPFNAGGSTGTSDTTHDRINLGSGGAGMVVTAANGLIQAGTVSGQSVSLTGGDSVALTDGAVDVTQVTTTGGALQLAAHSAAVGASPRDGDILVGSASVTGGLTSLQNNAAGATSGVISVGALTANDSVTMRSVNGLTLTGAATVTGAGHDLTLDGTTVNLGTSVNHAVAGRVDVTARTGAITSGAGMSLTSDSGNAAATASLVLDAATTITLGAGSSLNSNSAGIGLRYAAASSLTLGNLSGAQIANVNAGPAHTFIAGPLGNTIAIADLTAGTISTGNALDIEVAGNLRAVSAASTASSVRLRGGDITGLSLAPATNTANSDINFGRIAITAAAGSNVDVAARGLLQGGAIGGANITLAGGSVGNDGSIDVGAVTGTGTVSFTTVSGSAADVRYDADILASSISSGAGLTLDNSGGTVGNITVNNGLTVPGNLLIQSANTATVGGNVAVTGAGSTYTVTGKDVNITGTAAQTQTATGGIFITANGAGGVAALGGDISLRSTTGNVSVSSTGGSVAAATGGQVRSDTGSVSFTAATTATVNKAVSAGTDYLVSGTAVNLVTTAGAPVLQSAVGKVDVTAATGSITGGTNLRLESNASGAVPNSAVYLDAVLGTVNLALGSTIQSHGFGVGLRYAAGATVSLGDVTGLSLGQASITHLTVSQQLLGLGGFVGGAIVVDPASVFNIAAGAGDVRFGSISANSTAITGRDVTGLAITPGSGDGPDTNFGRFDITAGAGISTITADGLVQGNSFTGNALTVIAGQTVPASNGSIDINTVGGNAGVTLQTNSTSNADGRYDGDIRVGTVTSTGSIALLNTTGAGTFGNINVGTGLSATAGGVTVRASKLAAVGGNVAASGAGADAVIEGDTVQISGTTVAANRDATITARASTLTTNAGTSVTAGRDIALNGQTGLTLNGNAAATGNFVATAATGNVQIGATATQSGTTLTRYVATTGNIDALAGAATNSASGNVAFEALAGDATVRSTVAAGDQYLVTARTATLGGTTQTAQNAVLVQATLGALTTETGLTVASNAASATFTAANGATLDANVTASTIYAATATAGNMLIGANSVQQGNGGTSFTATAGNITASEGTQQLSTTGNVAFSAALGTVDLNSAVTAGANYTVSAQQVRLGVGAVGAVSQQAAVKADITATAGDILGGATLALQSNTAGVSILGTHVIVLDASGAINLDIASSLASHQDGIGLRAGGNISLGDLNGFAFASTNAAHTAFPVPLNVAGNFVARNITFTGPITSVNATGSIRFRSFNGPSLTLVGTDITGIAGDPAGTSAPLFGRFAANSSAAITVNANGLIQGGTLSGTTVSLTGGHVAASGIAGSVDVTSITSTTGDATVTAFSNAGDAAHDGDILVDTVNAAGAASLTSDAALLGDVVIGSRVVGGTGVTIKAARDVTLGTFNSVADTGVIRATAGAVNVTAKRSLYTTAGSASVLPTALNGIVSVDATGDLAITGTGDAQVGSLTAGGNLTLSLTGGLYGRASSGASVISGGAIQANGAGGLVDVKAGVAASPENNIVVLDRIQSSGAVTMSGDQLAIGTVNAVGMVTVTNTAGGALDLATAYVGPISFTGNGAMAFNGAPAIAGVLASEVISAGPAYAQENINAGFGHVNLTATAGSISGTVDTGAQLGTVQAGTSVNLTAGGLVADSVTSTTTTDLTANLGTLSVLAANVGTVMTLAKTGGLATTAANDVRVVTGTAGTGLSVNTSTQARLGSLTATTGDVSVQSTGGDVTGLRLFDTGASAAFSPVPVLPGVTGADAQETFSSHYGSANLTASAAAANVGVFANAGSAQLGTLQAGNNVTVGAVALAVNTATATAGALALTANSGSLFLGNGTAGTTATLIKSGGNPLTDLDDLRVAALSAPGLVTLTSSTHVRATGVSSTAGNVLVTAGGDVSGFKVGSGALVAGQIPLATVSTTTALNANYGLGGIGSSGGNVTINAVGGSVQLGGLTAAGNYTATARAVTGGAATPTGNLQLTATQGTLALASANVGGNITLTKQGGSALTAGDDLRVPTVSGSGLVTLASSTHLRANTVASLTNGVAVTATAGDITGVQTGFAVLPLVTTGTQFSGTALATQLTANNAVNGTITINAGGAAQLAAVAAGKDVTGTVGALAAPSVTAGGLVNLTANTGTLVIGTTSAGTTATLEKKGGVLATDGDELRLTTVTGGTGTALKSATHIRVGTATATTGALTASATNGDISGLKTGVGFVALPQVIPASGSAANYAGAVLAATAGSVAADALSGALLIDNAGALTDVTLTARGADLNVVNAGRDLTASATSGTLLLANGTAGRTALLTKAGAPGGSGDELRVIALNAGTTTAPGGATLTSSTSARIGTITTARGNIAVTASNGDVTGLTAPSSGTSDTAQGRAVLNANQAITVTATGLVQAGALTATTGGISITAGDATHDGAIDLTSAAAGGNIALLATAIAPVSAPVRDGDILVGSPLNAGGTITVDNTVTGGNSGIVALSGALTSGGNIAVTSATTASVLDAVTSGGDYVVTGSGTVPLGGAGATDQRAKGKVAITSTNGSVTQGAGALALSSNSDGIAADTLAVTGKTGVVLGNTALSGGLTGRTSAATLTSSDGAITVNTVDAATLTATAKTGFTANGAITTGNAGLGADALAGPASVDVTVSAGNISAKAITATAAGHDIHLGASGTITTDALLAARSIRIDGGTSATAATAFTAPSVTATAGSVSVRAGAMTVAGATTSGTDTTLNVTGAAQLGTANAGGNLSATTGSLTATSLTSTGTTSVTAGTINVTGLTSSAADVVLAAGTGAITLGSVTAATNLGATGGSIAVSGPTTVGGTATLTANTTTIALADATVGKLVASAKTGFTATGAIVGGTAAFPADAAAGPATVDVVVTNGGITTVGITTNGAGHDIHLGASGAIATAALNAARSFRVDGGTSATAAASFTAPTVTATAGTLTVNAGTANVAGAAVSGGDMSLTTTGATQLGSASSGAALSVTAASLNVTGAANSTGATTIATGTGAVQLGSSNAGGALTVNAGPITVTGAANAGGAVALNSGASAIQLGSTSAGTTLTATGATITVTGVANSGGAMALDATSGALQLGGVTSGGDVTLAAKTKATLGPVTAAGRTVTLTATDADLNGAVTASTVNLVNRGGANNDFRLGDGVAGSGGFELTATELNRIGAATVVIDAGTGTGLTRQDTVIGNLTLTNAALKNLNLYSLQRIDMSGNLKAATLTALRLGGTATATDLAAVIRMAAKIDGTGGLIDIGTASLELRSAIIGAGLDTGFLDQLGVIEGGVPSGVTAWTAANMVSNGASSLYNAAAFTGLVYQPRSDGTPQALVTASSMTVRYSNFALFQNTGLFGANEGVNLGTATTPAAPALSVAGPNPPDGGPMALFGKLNGIGNTNAALLGPSIIVVNGVDRTTARINGCLIGSGAGCLSTLTLSPVIGNVDPVRANIFFPNADFTLPFDPLVGTNNDSLFGDVGTFGLGDIPLAPIECAENDKSGCGQQKEGAQ